MHIRAYACTHEGRIRANNEDNFFVCGKYKENTAINRIYTSQKNAYEEYLYAVCDGMGGIDCGEVASLVAVKQIYQCCNKEKFSLKDCVFKCNTAVCNEMEKSGGVKMGSTLAALYIKENKAAVCNVGDSRVYKFSKNALVQLSKDHTQVNRMLNLGAITAEQALTHPSRHTLTQHLGIFEEEMLISPFVSEMIEINSGDMFLLCSDGLTDMLTDNEISDILHRHKSLKAAAGELCKAAFEHGGRDNITIVLVRAD